MVHGCLEFSYVLTIVGWPRSSVMAKLLLLFLESQPVETRVHVFGPSWGDGVVDDSERRGVFGFNWCGWLQISHRDERMAVGDGFA